MTDEERARLAEILEQVAEDGLHHPRDLDAALDAIDSEWKAALAAERERCAAWHDEQADIAESLDTIKYADRERARWHRRCAAAIRALGGER